MARTAATRAAQAASGLDAFLRDRAVVDTERLRKASGEENSGAADATAPREVAEPLPGATAASEAATPHVAPLRLAHTDWLHHTLRVSGPAEDVEEFRRAAAGAGVIPWILDLDRLEEDWFHLLLEPRRLSVAGARLLAGQLRDAVERRHALAVDRVGHSRACPFDLFSLVKLPPGILRLGPDHPDAWAWLWRHWGTTETLRHVVELTADESGRAAAADEKSTCDGAVRLSFWSADWSPWRALKKIRADWPGVGFELRPTYDIAA